MEKHMGNNVKRIREILGVKQETLASELGYTQQKMSSIEQKDKIEDDVLDLIASALRVPAEAIRQFNNEAAYNIVANNYHDQSATFQYNYNPLDKIVELYEGKMLLYERMLKEKDALLEKLLPAK